MKKFKSLPILSLLFFSLTAFSIPQPGTFKIKKITEKNILYIPLFDNHTEHFLNARLKIVDHYLINDNDDYHIIFPLMNIESKGIYDNSHYVAIAFDGSPRHVKEIKTTLLPGGLFASYIYKGSYINIDAAIRTAFQKILKTEKYLPHNDEEIRLLYWNSIKTNYPKNLITEIQIKVVPL